jgi:hypothetical protein
VNISKRRWQKISEGIKKEIERLITKLSIPDVRQPPSFSLLQIRLTAKILFHRLPEKIECQVDVLFSIA